VIYLNHVGTIGVHRTFSEGAPVFDVFFAPRINDSACNSRRFRALEELAEFLAFLDVREDMVLRTLDEIRAGRSALIPNVTLSDEIILGQGLDSTVTLNRRIN
jgi:hypothetical protein